MITMDSSFYCLLALGAFIVTLFLFYTKIWKMLIFTPLNKLIDLFYQRVTSDKTRCAVFMNHLETFPWLSHLEANWEAIRDELLCFVEKGSGMCNVHTTGGDELNKESKWKLSMILAYGEPIEELKGSFPLTLSILEGLPEVQNAAFSLLKGGGSIPPHCGSTASILRYHLALIVPGEGKLCRLTVNGGDIPWGEGKGILFDDTFEHSARNGAEEDRVVLIVDIFRPNLGLVDRWIQTLEVWKRTRDFHAGRVVKD